MAKRTDLAAPTVIDPAAFTFVAGVYFGSNADEDFHAMLGDWLDEKDPNNDKAGWYAKKPLVLEHFPPLNAAGNFVRRGTCDHCGARFDWGSVYQHTSGGHIVVGNVCAEKTLSVPSRLELDMNRMKARIAAARKAAKNVALAREQAVLNGFDWLYEGEHGNNVLDDIAKKGLVWGGLTVGQMELVKRIHSGTKAEWEVARDARNAARAAEEAAAQPVPHTDKRLEVSGVILSTRVQDGYMVGSTVTKMLVRAKEGYKLWGTVPRELMEAVAVTGEHDLKGKTVTFCARVDRSDKDEKFGFFSRPTKARIVAEGVTS